jgi:hypothetical protein
MCYRRASAGSFQHGDGASCDRRLKTLPLARSLIKTCKQDKTTLQEDVVWNIASQIVAGALMHCMLQNSS